MTRKIKDRNRKGQTKQQTTKETYKETAGQTFIKGNTIL